MSANQFMSEQDVERAACDLLVHPKLWAEMSWPAVTSVHRQVRVGRQVVDVLLKHVDGSLTVIEVKRGGLGLRDYATGLGQVICQSVMVAADFGVFNVRPVLALPWPSYPEIVFMCDRARVELLPLPNEREWADILDASHLN